MAAKKSDLSIDKKKDIAFDLYMNADMKQKEIAEKVGVTEKTIGKWVEAGMWAELKSAGSITAARIVQNLYRKMAEITETDAGKINADELVKIARTIELISNKKVTVSQVINAFKGFTTFLFTRKPELAKQIVGYQKEYVEELING